MDVRTGSSSLAGLRNDSVLPLFLRLFRREPMPDPYPVYARLREAGPVLPFRLPGVPRGYLLTTFEHSASMLRDPHVVALPPSVMDAVCPGWRDSRYAWATYHSALFASGKLHQRLRAVLSRYFTPRAVEQHRGAVRRIADSLLNNVADAGATGAAVDLATDLAQPYASLVTGHLLGLDDDEALLLGTLTRECGVVLELAPCERNIHAPGEQVLAALAEIAEDRRRHPRDDVISDLVSQYAPDDDELITTVALALLGGTDAPSRLSGLGCWLLLSHPVQADLLREEPALAQSAAAEIMRYDPAVQLVPRLVVEPTQCAGVDLVPGDLVMAAVASAHRDPAYVTDPDRFDITRTPLPGLGFSGGPHYCLGSALGKILAEELFSGLVRRFPDMRPAGPPTFRSPGTTLRGLDHLPAWTGR